jgi:hypothetical protein
MNEFIPPKAAEKLQQINWETLTLDELIDLLDRLGLGFYETLVWLLKKLKPGHKQILMRLVTRAKIGQRRHIYLTKQELEKIKNDPNIPTEIKRLLTVLDWRADNKFSHDDMGVFAKFGKLQQV